jgi:hypothetical protein
MKRALIALLLCLAAQLAQADMVWKLWCQDPGDVEETPRKGMYDTSAGCHQSISTVVSDVNTRCHDTKQGPRWGEKHEKVEAWARFPNCAALKKLYESCICKPESVK